MNKKIILLSLFLATLFLVAFTLTDNDYKANIIKKRQEKIQRLKDKKTSPLTKKDRKKFTTLNYYDVDENFRIETSFTRTPDEKPIDIETSNQSKKQFLKYGELRLNIEGMGLVLAAYQNVKFSQSPEYDSTLFIPFMDLTSGNATYGGGRYLDIKIPKGDKAILDFNLAYNPYCSYGSGFSCPIPPANNFLKVEVTAGEKKYNGNH